MAARNQKPRPNPVGKGGKRAGAGRKPGALTQRTREIAEKTAATGLTPLEVMVKAMREADERADELRALAEKEKDPKERLALAGAAVRLRAQAADVAQSAAPYMHPRLQSIEQKVSGSLEQKPTEELQRELDMIRAEIARLTGTPA